MVSSDTVVGIVGAVILTGAMIAVFYYENNTVDDGGAIIGEGGNVYTFQYEQQNETPVESKTVTVSQVGGSQDVTFDLPAYVFNVHAVVTWSETGDQAPDPLASGMDAATVQLLNEGGTELDKQTGRSGELMVHHGHDDPADTNTTPPQMTVQVRGDSPEDAEANLKNETEGEDAHGVGTWTIKITLDDTGDSGTAGQTDTSNDFTVTVTYSYWAPVLQQ